MRKYFKIGQYFVTVPPEKNALKIINPIGQFILESLDEGMSESDISKDIADIVGISNKQAKYDVSLFLQDYEKSLPAITSSLSSEKIKATFIAPQTKTQIVVFPTFTLKITHENKESFDLVEPFFKHLETTREKPSVIDYNLHFQKNKKQEWEVIYDKHIILSGVKLDSIVLPALFYIYEHAYRKKSYLILLHASGVTYDGSSIIFPAIGNSGKSTLCAALIKRGFGYINDDVIPVDYESGDLISIPFCMGIRPGSWNLLEKYYPDIAERYVFGEGIFKKKYLPPPISNQTKATHKVNFLVIPCYQKGNKCTLESTSSINGLKAIIEGESIMKLPLIDSDVEYLVRWVENLACYKLTYDCIEDAILILKENLF